MKNFNKIKLILSIAIIGLSATACTFSGASKKKEDSALGFITGTTAIDKANDVHIVNLTRAIGAPINNVMIDKYKYYSWQHSRTVGVSTLFGGGSTTLYCNLTAETQNNKIKLINWYGNYCSIFLTPISDYFKDKLNIYVIIDEDEKKSEAVKNAVGSEAEQGQKINPNPENKPVIDLRQKTSEQKAVEQQKTAEKNIEQKPSEVRAIEQKIPAVEQAVEGKANN